MNSKKYINLLKNDKKELLEVIDELKNRINKAIEYINIEIPLGMSYNEDLLNILQGEYDEKNN